jgi:hypothetical protein
MCRPHCWQYANPIGVAVPHRGQLIVLPSAAGARLSERGAREGSSCDGAIAGAYAGAIIGAGAGTGWLPKLARGPAAAADDCASDAPQLRQNFMPGGFSPRHIWQIVGNPAAGAGVCAAEARALPQFKQNDAPGRLSWPHTEQRIATEFRTK